MESELRQDIVSGDWVMIAPGRAKKGPLGLIKQEKRKKTPQKGCPFCDPKINPGKPILFYPTKENYLIRVIENKFPVLTHKKNHARFFKKGLYCVVEGTGHHELVITKDHDKNFAHLGKKDAIRVFEIFLDRYLTIFNNDSCCAYVSIFHNWGPKAGASIYHPHYQMIAIPVVPPDVNHSLIGSERYFKKHKKCVHCEMIKYEKKEKKRIIYENKEAIVFAPFVSREPFEIRVFPKKHLPYFEGTKPDELKGIIEALQKGLLKIEKKLHDPDYNFFIHTAPIKDKARYKFYHWHIEVQPKISISAGFELATGVEITIVDPNDAAKILK